MTNSKKEFPLLIIVGMTGSGKSTVSKILYENGMCIIRFGDLTITELKRRNLEICEKNERSVREELRKKYGPDAYAKLALEKIKECISKSPVVIDGLYSWSEYKYLLENIRIKMYIILVFTEKHLRYQRLTGRDDRALSIEEAKSRDIAEIENIEKGGPIAFADFLIINNDITNELRLSVEKLINEKISIVT